MQTETEYIVTGDLARVNMLNNILRDLLPDTNPNIPKDEITTVARLILKWQESSYRWLEKQQEPPAPQ